MTSTGITRNSPGNRTIRTISDVINETGDVNAEETFPYDKDLLDTREVMGLRHKFRVHSKNFLPVYNILEDSGVLSTDQFVHKYMLIQKELSDVICDAEVKCGKCQFRIPVEEHAKYAAAEPTGRCTSDNFVNSLITKHSKINGKYYPLNLSQVYMSIYSGFGFRGLQNYYWATNLENEIPEKQFYKHASFLYNVMDAFYSLNMPNVRKDVIDFYERNGLGVVDEIGILDICISLDGSFDHIGYDASHCASIAVEVYTGRPVDVIMTAKCLKCDDRNDFRTNGTCKFGLFHGASGDMEKYNALQLFNRSMAIGLRYTSYVGDGDCKNHAALVASQPYGEGVVIYKLECANHLGKRCYKKLENFGNSWTGNKDKEEDKEGDKEEDSGKGAKKKAKENAREKEDKEKAIGKHGVDITGYYWVSGSQEGKSLARVLVVVRKGSQVVRVLVVQRGSQVVSVERQRIVKVTIVPF